VKNSPARSKKRPQLRPVFLILGTAILIAAYVLLPQLHTVSESLASLKNVEWPQILAASLLTFITFIAASITLVNISAKGITFGVTLLVQAASGFATKLAPAGIGGFALNTRYLVKQRHTIVQASSVMAINGLLGFMGHMLIILLALLFAKETLEQTLSFSVPPLLIIIAGLMLASLLFSVVFFEAIRQRVINALNQLSNLAKLFKNRPRRLIFGFIGALAVTLLYTTVLYLCASSLNVELNFLQSLLVFTAGAIGSSVTPTPGGLGGAEAALTAALVAVGIESGVALSVALVYRLVTYWLPILPGILCFQIALRRGYI